MYINGLSIDAIRQAQQAAHSIQQMHEAARAIKIAERGTQLGIVREAQERSEQLTKAANYGTAEAYIRDARKAMEEYRQSQALTKLGVSAQSIR